jgi:hypothetical protein
MPGDLSENAMSTYIKNEIVRFDRLRTRDEKAAQMNHIFTYLLTYFPHVVRNFGSKKKFFLVIKEKCLNTINDEKLAKYEELLQTSLRLLEKVKKADEMVG